jgi:multiple sugar transport system substrate-binding protein
MEESGMVRSRLTRIVGMALVMIMVCALSGGAFAADKPKGDILVWGWPTHDKGYEAIIKGFNAIYPDIHVKWEMLPNAAETLSTALAAGSGLPDVTAIEINNIDRFVLQGGFEDLLKPPYNAGKYKEDFVAYQWAQASTPDGKLLAMPWDIGPASMFYRRDVLEKAGLASDPESVAKMLSTWKDYIEVGQKVAKPDQNIFWTDNASEIPYIYFAHKNFFDEKYNIAINNPKTLEVLQYAKQIRDLKLDAKSTLWTEEWYATMRNGEAATIISGCWFGSFLKNVVDPDGAGRWGVIPIPQDPQQNWGGSFLAIPEKAANKEAAWAFVEYVTATVEGQNGIFKSVDYYPAYKPAWKDPVYQEGDPFFGGQKTRELWMNIANAPGKIITTPMDAAAEKAFSGEVAKMLNEGLDPQATIAAAEKAITEQTAQDRAVILEMSKKK